MTSQIHADRPDFDTLSGLLQLFARLVHLLLTMSDNDELLDTPLDQFGCDGLSDSRATSGDKSGGGSIVDGGWSHDVGCRRKDLVLACGG